MLNRKNPRQPPRLPVYSEVINRAAEAGEFSLTSDGSIGVARIGNAWLLRLAAKLVGIRAAKADLGAIAAQAQGTVTLYEDITAANLTTDTLEVVNPMQVTDCPSGAPLVWLLTAGGVTVILGWECA